MKESIIFIWYIITLSFYLKLFSSPIKFDTLFINTTAKLFFELKIFNLSIKSFKARFMLDLNLSSFFSICYTILILSMTNNLNLLLLFIWITNFIFEILLFKLVDFFYKFFTHKFDEIFYLWSMKYIYLVKNQIVCYIFVQLIF
jgi:hypothetical protein